ncbi:MAG: endonuclease [Mojavia pulchra JT2-VF2]|jgi:endonuclease I/V8-like Glu-specific endopeptidase|uniref:Serine protease n=1 Tax=Mojavia pulchra JT2-VF2 TaxID=287848 RepID=A0A951PUC1_9NOST|nr:endonuclease [Mojavia pulchra JT2-VF2]
MAITYQLIQETTARYKQRHQEREEHLRELETGNLLTVDTPERVTKRLERIANHPLAVTMIAEESQPELAGVKILSPENFNRLVQERILGQSDLMSVSYLEYGLSVSRSIGRILIRNNSNRLVGYGTGFMVSPCLLLTNNHVLSNAQEAGFSLIEFNYQSGVGGQMLQSYTYELNPDTFFVTDKHLDFSLVAVKDSSNGQPPLATFGWNRLIEEEGKAILGEYVNIIQHPSGQPKQLALRENQLVDLFDDFLHYQTDTAPGSSGSPVFNDQWEVVGLHHSGVPRKDEQGNILAIDGQVWTPQIGEDRIAWEANEGIRISRIVKYIKQQNLSPTQRRLRDEMFDHLPPSPEAIKEQTPKIFAKSANLASDGSITWTIPLQVSVRLGDLAISSARVPQSGNVSSQPPNDSHRDDTQPDIKTDPELAQELQLLERVRRGTIPYYDEVGDRTERNNYYGNLIDRASSLNSGELFKELKDLLRTTHTQLLSYNPRSRLYPWVDLQPDLTIRSIYSRLKFEPEQIIREDLEIERERSARLQELIRSESFGNTVQLSEQIDLLESELRYNCEHVVPQSWFQKKEPMRGDLHHLFACESVCNSFRGNTPYYDFPDFEEAMRTNCGKSEGKKFEPGNGKGEVARATFYFLLRYPGQIDNKSNEYEAQRLETLLKWHQSFPVTEHEKHRNMAIYKKQGNRNPLIDFPEWADKIDFRLGLG